MPAHRAVNRVVHIVVSAAIAVGAIGAASLALAAPVAAATYESGACKVEIPAEYSARATCGSLTVPASRAEGSDPANVIRIPVVQIAASSATPALDPLIVLTAGMPGGGALDSLDYVFEHGEWATADRTVIVIGQRGDALANPSLDCPELDTAKFVVDGEYPSRGADASLRGVQVQKCHDRLVADGVDLSAYTSSASAADLAELRIALGYDQWNLYALGSGTRLAYATMRDQAAGLRSVILDAPEPLEVNLHETAPAGFRSSVDALIAGCAADTECHGLHPDLAASLAALLDRSDPLVVDVRNPVDGSPVRLELHGADLAWALYAGLGDADAVRVLPFAIDRAAHGDSDALLPLLQHGLDDADLAAEGLQLSIDCAEEIPFNDDAVIAAAGAADPLVAHLAPDASSRADCATWGVPVLAGESQTVVSGIPTLIMVGGYDPSGGTVGIAGTAAGAADAAGTVGAAGLSAARVYAFPAAAHGVVWATEGGGCPASLALQFLRDPAVELDSSCIEALPATDFVTTADVIPTAAVYHLERDLVQERNPVQIAIVVITVALLLATVIYGIVYGLAWAARRRGDAPGGTVLVATTAATLQLGYLTGVVLVLLGTEPLILGFGLPSAIWPLLIVPFIALGATILLIVLLVRVWRQGEGALGIRVFLSLSAAASTAFTVWLLARGMLVP